MPTPRPRRLTQPSAPEGRTMPSSRRARPALSSSLPGNRTASCRAPR